MAAKRFLFDLIDHCCSVCGGRLLRADASGGEVLIRCAECGASKTVAASVKAPHEALCFCGMRLAGGGDAGMRCRRVEHTTPERPQEVVVRHDPPAPRRRDATPGRPARSPASE